MNFAAKLTLIFLLLSIMPLSVVGYGAYENSQQTIKQDVIDRLLTTTLLKESEFVSWLDDSKGDLETLAIRPTLREYSIVMDSHFPVSRDYDAAHDYILNNQLLPNLSIQDNFLGFVLIRATDGMIVVSTEKDLEGKYRENETFFIEGQKSTYVANIIYEVSQGQQVMHISTPVKDDQGTVIAVLAGHMDLNKISDIMIRRSGLRQTEKTYLVNTFNFVVAQNAFEPDAHLTRSVYTEGVNDCLKQHNNSGFYTDYRNVPVIGAYQWMPDYKLCIITEIDQAEAMARIHDLRRSILYIGMIIGLGVTLAGGFFARTITGPVQRLVKGTHEISQGNWDYKVGTAAKDEIGQLSREFDQMAETLKATTVSRDELEQRVTERTAQLEASNKELEAFSYSVSHDLRAPLRAMDGFSRILLEDYAAALPADAQRYLELVRENAQQMGSLIDHLLTFSRLGRQTLTKEQIDTAHLVQGVINDLNMAREEEHPVTITVGDLPFCLADPALLRQVFANLLGNAVKFSHTRNPAIIEVGCNNHAEEPVYFVRDNGVGFDMQYANKLFGVFQRLHRAEDYEGTGVGLATVQRIIHRHGGRIWAEAEIEKGATFYFTLGGESE